MTTTTLSRTRGAVSSRRTLYRRGKRVLVRLLAGRWRGPRRGLEPAVRRFLKTMSGRDLRSLVGDPRVALAVASTLLASGSALAEPPVELSDVAAGSGGFVMNGIDFGDYSGFGVSGAGDVNGDGLDDLIVGAFGADPGGVSTAGESYVVFGKADTTAVELADVAAGSGGFVINGIGPSDASGTSISPQGDVNGDGLADVIVGASQAAPGGANSAGESYVVFGKSDTTAVELADVVAGGPMAGGFVINGIDSADFSGGSVSGAGDVNGDGLADLIVGARLADPGGANSAGESYVVFGKSDTTAVELSDVAAGGPMAGGFVINGADAGDFSGLSVSGAGDVNGDGLADLIVGAYGGAPGGANQAGESYVVFGKADTTAVELADVAAGSGGFVMNGIDSGDRSGRSVSGAGDVNGDGLADLIVGARNADPGGVYYAGESYVVFGKADTAAVELSDVAAGGPMAGGFVMHGIETFDHSGESVSGAGDVNGDGLADLIVGASEEGDGHGGGGDSTGKSYVVFGKADTAAVELPDVVAGTGGFVIRGTDAGDSAWHVSGAGDVNGDGFDDVIVGAHRANPGGVGVAGESYVIFGTGPTKTCDADLTCDGFVGMEDLNVVLAGWGTCRGSCPADLDGNGSVGFTDLNIMLAAWGPIS